MPMSAEERSPEAGTGLREALRWQWWIPLLCAVSLGLAGFLLARLGDREYQAEALLQVNNANLAAEVVGVWAGTPSSRFRTCSPSSPHGFTNAVLRGGRPRLRA